MSQVKAGAAYVELFLKNNQLTKGLANAKKQLSAFGKGVATMGAAITAAGAAVIGPTVAMAQQFAGVGDAVNKMAARTGLSAEAVSTLAFAAEQSGSNIEGLEAGVRGMQKSLQGLAEGSQQSVDTFAALGLNMKRLEGLTPEEQFLKIADSIAGISDPAKRAAMAMRVFGKSGAALLPMIAGGAAGIKALQAEADALNIGISTDDADSAAAYTDAMNRLAKTLRGVMMQVGAAVAPMLTDLTNLIAGVIAGVVTWVRENRGLVATVFQVAAGVAAAGMVITGIGAGIIAAGLALGALGTIVSAVGTAFGVLGAVVGAILTPVGALVVGVAALGAYLVHVSGAGVKALAWLRGAFDSLAGDAIGAFGAIRNALAAGDIAAAGQVLWALLKLQWTKGVAFLQDTWAGFKDFLSKTSSDIVYATAGVFIDGAAAVAKGWIATVDMLADAWAVFASGVRNIWNSTVGWLKKAWVKLKSLIDSDIDVEAEVKRIDDETAGKNATDTEARNRAILDRETERKKRFAGIDQTRDDVKGTLGQMQGEADAERARRKAAADAVTTEAEAALATARDEFAAAVANANAATPAQLPKPPTVPPLEVDDVEVPDVDLSSNAADTLENFGKSAAAELSDVTAGFDGLGMGFGGSARAIEAAPAPMVGDTPTDTTDTSEDPQVDAETPDTPNVPQVDVAPLGTPDPLEAQLDRAVETMPPVVVPVMPPPIAAAGASVAAAAASVDRVSPPAAATNVAATDPELRAQMAKVAENTRDLAALARRGRLVFV